MTDTDPQYPADQAESDAPDEAPAHRPSSAVALSTPDPIEWFADRFDRIAGNVERVIQGKRQVIERVLTTMFAEGHVLVEDVPGVGKTALAKSVARSIDCSFNRIQFTPDLLPSDVTGVSVWDRQTETFAFKPGAIFANIVVGDEINRASPKTQSALLEAMEERQVTTDGITRPLPPPFMVVATQNPLEHEGTYPLPEAQLDRFMVRVRIGYPDRAKEMEMLGAHAIHSTFDDLKPVVHAREVVHMIDIARRIRVASSVKAYILDLVEATRDHPEMLLGASPRASLHLQRLSRARAAVEGRDYVTPDDVKAVAIPVLDHRMALRPEANMRGIRAGELLDEMVGRIAVPSSTRIAT